jgi:hypothetical protein
MFSVIYAGCAPRAVRDSVHVLDTGQTLERALLRSAVVGPFPDAPLLLPASPASKRAGCHRFRPAWSTFGDGSPLTAQDIVQHWLRGLREGAAHGWLLEPVRGAGAVARGAASQASGLRADGATLLVCFDRPVPDWRERLAHPALWPVRADAAGGTVGVGRFRWLAGERALVELRPGRGPQRVALVVPDERGIEIDLALVRGGGARPLEQVLPGGRFRTVEGWDRVWALWIDPRAAWVGDPAFRRWLAMSIDRGSMADLLFGDGGSAARGLSSDAGEPAVDWIDRGAPFGATSRPQLSLAFDSGDPQAERIASRVRAVLAPLGVRVDLAPFDVVDVAGESPAALRLVAHDPAVSDPVLALLDTLWPLAGEDLAETRRLLDASAIPSREERRIAAAGVEDELLRNARLVPLVRLEGRLVTHAALRGVRAGPRGVLDLRRARWSR